MLLGLKFSIPGFLGGRKIWGIGRNRVSFTRDGQGMVSCTGKINDSADKYFLSSIIPVNDEIQIRALEADQSLASNLMRQQVNFWLKVPVELSLNFIETNVKMNTV